jgi:hypothetical protein
MGRLTCWRGATALCQGGGSHVERRGSHTREDVFVPEDRVTMLVVNARKR